MFQHERKTWNSLKGKRGAALVRVSGDQQDTDRQIETLKNFIKKWSLSIGEEDWYDDVRSRMEAADERKAVDFHRLLKRVQEEAYDYILIPAQNRFGMLHDFEFGDFCNTLLKHGVELWDTINGHLNDPLDFATRVVTVVHNAASDAELTEKAYHTITGKVEAIKKGVTYFGGNLPYGTAVAIFAKDGSLKFRVELLESKRVPVVHKKKKHIYVTRWQKVYPDGTVEEKEGTFPAYEDDDCPRYVWSEIPGRLETVRQVFHWYDMESWTWNGIAAKLTGLGIGGYYGPCWQSVQIKNLLKNPIYIGIPTWNKGGGEAKKWEYINKQFVPVPLHKNRPNPVKKRTEEDYLPIPEQFRPDPIIPIEQFNLVQEKIRAEEEKSKPKPPRKAKLWLTGLLYCAKCEQPMYGQCGQRKHRKHPQYVCSTYKRHHGKDNPTNCWKNTVRIELLEQLVQDYLDECQVDIDTLVEGKDNPDVLKPLADKWSMAGKEFRESFARLRRYIWERLPEGVSEFPLPVGIGTVPVKVTKDGSVEDSYEIEDEAATSLDVYRHLCATDQTRIVLERCDLCRQREDLYEKMKTYKSEYARQRADEEMDALSAKIAALDVELSRLDTQVEERFQMLMEAKWALQEARQAFQGDSERRKAETVRKVIKKIICTFEEVPGATSQQASTRLVKVEIWPADERWQPKAICGQFHMASTSATARN